MASDLQIQGEVVVNSEKAESAFDRVGDKAQQMANEVATSAGKAGQAVDKIGDGAGASAQKLTKAQSLFAASIAKSTEQLQLLGKTASQQFEFKMNAKGFDPALFEPALQKLREVEAQAQAAQRAATGSLDKMGISAAQTAAALRGVPAQFTDIVTSLQGGQAPLTVFLQQGGQLRDMFGGAGAAARALGGYVLSLVNPFTVAAAAAAALAYAYNQGGKEADAYNTALITTGNAAGTNAAQLKAYAQEISAVVGTQGKAAESLAALASTGKIGAESLKEAAQAAVQYERATGQAVEKTAEQFASLRNEPLAAVLKLNDGMNFLTDSTYKQIKSLEEQGRTAEAANVAQRAFADTLAGRASEMERNLGTVERGWLAVKDAAKSAWDAILNVGRASTNLDQLAAVRKQIADRENQLANGGFGANGGGAAFGRPSQAATERLRAELSALQAQAAALEGVAFASRTAAEEERKRGEQVKATAAFDKAGEKYLTDKARMERELAAARVQGAEAGKSQAEIEQRLAQIRESYAKKGGGSSGIAAENKELRDQQRIYAELADVSSTYYADLEKAQQQRAKGNLSEAQYVKYVEDLIQKQPFAVALVKAETEARKAFLQIAEQERQQRLKIAQAAEQSVDSLATGNQQLRDEIQLIGLSATEQMEVLRLREESVLLVKEQHLAEMKRAEDMTGTMTRERIALEQEIELRRERLNLMGQKSQREQFAEFSKQTEQEWRRTVDQYGDIFRQGFADMLNNGKDGWKSFTRSLVTTFKTTVADQIYKMFAQPFVVNIVGNLLGVTGGGAGGAAMQMASGGGGSGVLGMGSNIASIFGAGGVGGSLMAGAGWLTGATTLGGALGAGASLIGTGTMAGAMSGIGMTAGALGPIALGVAALTSLISSLDDSGTPHAGAGAVYSGGKVTGGRDVYSYDRFDLADMNTYSDQVQGLVSPVAQSIGAALDAFATAFGQQAGYTVSTAFADDSSKDASWGALRIEDALGQVLVDWNSDRQSKWAPREFADGEEGQKEYLAAIARDTRDALKTAIGDADWAKDMLDTLGDSVTLEGLGSVVAQINQAKAAFTSFGQYMPTFAGLAQSAVSAMVDAAGGVDPLAQGMATFVENFYSDAEKLAINTENVRKALQELGFEMPETRDEFKALVQAQLALGDAGAKTAAGLLGLSGAFAAVTPAAESAQASIASVSDQLRDAFGMTADAVSGILSDAVKNAETASEAQRMASQAFEDKFYGGALDGLTDSLGAMIQSSVIAPMMESLIAGSAASASLLASGGAVAAGAMASGGAAGGAASAAGGSSAAGAMASGGASAANAMVSGGSAAGAIVASAVEQARAQVNAYTQILSDPDVQAGIKDISKLMGEVAGMTFAAKSSWGGGGYSAASFNASGAGSEADKLAESLKKLGETMGNEVKRLRGLMVDDSAQSQAVLLARFTSSTAAARAGDMKAAEALPELSKLLETATAASAMNSIELARMRGWLAGSLEETAKIAGIKLPEYAIGTNYVPRTMAAVIHEGEAIVPKAYNPWAGGIGGTSQMSTARLEALVERLTDDNRNHAAEIARLNLRLVRIAEQWEAGGMPQPRTERWEPAV